MERRRLLRLWANQDLQEYIKSQARRYFSCQQDQEDATAEAWEKIAARGNGHPNSELRHIAYCAIFAMYQRERRRRQQNVIINCEDPDPGVNG